MINTAQTLFFVEPKHPREFANIYDEYAETSIPQTAIADHNTK